jgi:uncharacterized protein YjdB
VDYGRKKILAYMKFNRSMYVVLLLLVAITGFGFSFVGSVKAATTFIVNTTTDVMDAYPGNGICDDGNGNCSIRAALMEANALAGADTITIPPGTYTLNSTFGQLVISSDVILNGNLGNPANTIIQAASNAVSATNRVLSINPNVSTPGFDVKIQGLTIRYGKAPLGYGGGGIDGDAGTRTIEIAHSIIEDNHTSGIGFGGGAYLSGAAGGTVKLNDVTFQNNEAGISSYSSYSSQGGGVFLQGDMNLDLVNVNIISNKSYGLGGGMAITPETTAARIVTITSSSITGNRAYSKVNMAGSEGQAGGIYLGVPANISQTAITGNVADGDGGGLVVDNYFGSVSLNTVALTGNTAVRGGAIYVSGSSIPSLISGVVMSGNTVGDLTINPDKQDLQVAIAPASGSNGTFSPGKTGAHYTITVYNSGTPPVSGPVTTVVTLPTGMTPTEMSGSGWTCNYNTLTCSRTDIPPQGQSAYPSIDLTVNVAVNAARTLTSSVTVSGGTEMNTSNNSASYATTVVSNDALLSNLTVSKGTLAPTFDASTRAYTVSLPYMDDTLRIMPTVNESHATVTVNDSSVDSATWSEPISLQVGNTEISITVRAEDGTTATTVVTVTRALPVVSNIEVLSDNNTTSVMIGHTLQMSANVLPENAGNKSVTWSVEAGTSNASINSEGLLTGTAVGEVVVKATAKDGSGIYGSKSITIVPVMVTSIDVMSQGEASSVENGEQLQLSALVYPTDATNRTVVWSVVPGTGDAEIDESTGLLTGTAVGVVLVKAAATDDSGIVGTMNIEITKIPVTSIEVMSESETTNVRNGKTLQLRALVSPDDATDASVTWSVEREGTGDASIDSFGVLTGTTVGKVIVKATANDNPEIVGTLEVTIKSIPVTGIVITSEGESASVLNGKTLQMIALVSPDDATDRTVEWSVVPGTGDASIDSSGVLTGAEIGTVTVTATADDNPDIVGTLEVTIEAIPVTEIIVTSANNVISIANGSPLQMSASVVPENATNASVKWSVVPGTGNAVVDETTGILRGTAVGTVTVKATANDGSNIVGSKSIEIAAIPVTSIVVTGNDEATSVPNGSTLQMYADVLPGNATNKSVTWSVEQGSENATIDEMTGLLTGTAVGEVVVKATANDLSGVVGRKTITIAAIPVTSIVVTGKDEATSVPNGSTLQMNADVLPGNATNKSVTWSVEQGSENATIDEMTGLLTGTAVGEVVVKATANDLSGVVGRKTITIAAIPVTSIVVTGKDEATSVSNGSTLQMHADVLPGNATNKSVTWSVEQGSENATIDETTGLLTGTAVGEVVVKATANDLSGVVGRKTITIAAIPVTSIVVTGKDEATSVPNGSTLDMNADVSPGNATNTSVTWSVEAGTGTATISPTGLLTGTTVGTVTVKATAKDNPGIVGTKIITVTALPVNSIVVTGTDNATTVINGSSLQMNAAVWPENASNTDVTWSVVANTGKATISATGLLTGTQVGTVTVIATAVDGSATKGSTIITITAKPVSHIEVKGAGNLTSVVAGNTLQMIANVLPEDASNASVTWSVYGTSGAATISDLGVLNAIEPGIVTVTATATDGSGIKGSAAITITPVPEVPVMTISISVKETSNRDAVVIGGTLQLEASVLPLNVTNSSVTWHVYGNTGNAIISQSGFLTAIGIGTVTVEARANDGSGIVGNKVITITSDAPQIKISPISTKVQGEVVELSGTTNLNGLTITILAPNDSVLTSFNDVTITNGTFFDSRFILPANTEPGMYKVIANNGIISTEVSFVIIPTTTFALLDHDDDGRIQIDEVVTFISSDSLTRDFNLDGRIDRNDITFILSLISSMKD